MASQPGISLPGLSIERAPRNSPIRRFLFGDVKERCVNEQVLGPTIGAGVSIVQRSALNLQPTHHPKVFVVEYMAMVHG